MSTPAIKDNLTHWMDNAGRQPTLPVETLTSIATRIQSLPVKDPTRGRLVNKIVVHNLRLIVFVVRGYLSSASSQRGWGCPETVDFLQVGVMGLTRAAELYDPTKGYTFATYASYWIRSKVSRYAIQSRSLVHVNESTSRKIISYNKNGFIKNRQNGEPMDEAIAGPMIREAQAAQRCVSLNVKTEEGSEILELIRDHSGDGTDHDLPYAVDKALEAAGVSPLGKKILILRYGHGYSQRETADMLGITMNAIKTHCSLSMKRAKQSKELAGMV